MHTVGTFHVVLRTERSHPGTIRAFRLMSPHEGKVQSMRFYSQFVHRLHVQESANCKAAILNSLYPQFTLRLLDQGLQPAKLLLECSRTKSAYLFLWA